MSTTSITTVRRSGEYGIAARAGAALDNNERVALCAYLFDQIDGTKGLRPEAQADAAEIMDRLRGFDASTEDAEADPVFTGANAEPGFWRRIDTEMSRGEGVSATARGFVLLVITAVLDGATGTTARVEPTENGSATIFFDNPEYEHTLAAQVDSQGDLIEFLAVELSEAGRFKSSTDARDTDEFAAIETCGIMILPSGAAYDFALTPTDKAQEAAALVRRCVKDFATYQESLLPQFGGGLSLIYVEEGSAEMVMFLIDASGQITGHQVAEVDAQGRIGPFDDARGNKLWLALEAAGGQVAKPGGP